MSNMLFFLLPLNLVSERVFSSHPELCGERGMLVRSERLDVSFQDVDVHCRRDYGHVFQFLRLS